MLLQVRKLHVSLCSEQVHGHVEDRYCPHATVQVKRAKGSTSNTSEGQSSTLC